MSSSLPLSNGEKYFNEMILYGNVCYYYDEFDASACSKENNKSLISIEPDGLFKFSTDSMRQTITLRTAENQTTSVEFTCEREFGSLNQVNLIYALASLSNTTTTTTTPLDFYFNTNTNYLSPIKFEKFHYRASFSLGLNSIFLRARRDFLIYLTNTISSNSSSSSSFQIEYETSKVSKYNRTGHLTLMPSRSEYENVFGFAQSLVVVPIVLDVAQINFSVLIFRLGVAMRNMTTPTSSVSVKSGGYGDSIPDYVVVGQYVGISLSSLSQPFQLAYPGLEFQEINTLLEYNNNQNQVNLTFSIYANFSTDFNLTHSSSYQARVFYLYLGNKIRICYTPFLGGDD